MPEASDIAYQILDHLMLQLGRAWRVAEVKVALDGGVARATSWTADRVPPRVGIDRGAIVLDDAWWVERLNGLVTLLFAELEPGWTEPRLALHRQAQGRFALDVLSASPSPSAGFRLEGTDLLFGDSAIALLAAMPAVEGPPAASAWSFDPERGELHLGEEPPKRASWIGSWFSADAVFRWAWSMEEASAVGALQRSMDGFPGLLLLGAPAFDADLGVADAVARLAADGLGHGVLALALPDGAGVAWFAVAPGALSPGRA